MSSGSPSQTLTLANSVTVPQLGFGVYKSIGDKCVKACLAALDAGYRHIDSAQYYENEAEVGQALKQSGLQRKDVFLATKILFPRGSVRETYKHCLNSVQSMDPDPNDGYVDLFMIHSPSGGSEAIKEMWQALEDLYAQGKAKSIGVSNFGIKHIEGMKSYAKIWPPHVNQIELHPWLQQPDIVNYCHKNGIIVEAYCPLVRNEKAQDPTLKRIAETHNATTNQVLIRYSLQKGWCPLPKSETPERIRSNIDVFGFSLTDEDMATLDGLDQGASGALVLAVEN